MDESLLMHYNVQRFCVVVEYKAKTLNYLQTLKECINIGFALNPPLYKTSVVR